VARRVSGIQRLAKPIAPRVALKIRERVEANVLGMTIVVDFHWGDEQSFAFGGASALGPDDGIAGPDHAGEEAAGLALGHGFEEFVIDPQGGGIAEA
jgi:hypothetical protein